MSGLVGHVGLLLGGSWTPAQLAVLPNIWLDDLSATTNVSGLASQINDRSGNAAHFSQPNATFRPQIVTGALNGRRVLRFDGVDDRMENQSSRAIYQNATSGVMMTVYTKRTNDASPIGRSIFAANTGNLTTRFSIGAGLPTAGNANKPFIIARRLDADAISILPGATSRPNTVMVIGIVNYATGVGSVYVDGELSATASGFTSTGSTSNTDPGSSSPFQLGASVSGSTPVWGSFSDIDLAASLAWRNYIPSSGDIDRLFGWAAWRYGLQANLPIGHPYKNSPP